MFPDDSFRTPIDIVQCEDTFRVKLSLGANVRRACHWSADILIIQPGRFQR